MKKILKTAAVALAGMLAFGLAACTDGDEALADEIPFNYAPINNSGNDTSITAYWDFTKNDWGFSESEVGISGIIPTSGKTTGAVLTATNIKAKYNSGLQLSKGTASLSNLGGSYYFELTLEGQSNIQIYAKGAGSAEPARLVSVYNEAGERIAEKDNLVSGIKNDDLLKDATIRIEGVPKGKYTVYANGVTIIRISANASDKVVPLKSVTGISLATGATTDTYELAITDFLELPSVCDADDLSKVLSPQWIVINNDPSDVEVAKINGTKLVATYAGKATVRARVGMHILDCNLTVTGSADFKVEPPSGKQIEALTGSLQLKALRKDNSADISSNVSWTSTDPSVATVANGKILALKAGKTNIVASFTDGKGTSYKDTVTDIEVTDCTKTIVTLLDTTSTSFPTQGTAVVADNDVWKSVFGEIVSFRKYDTKEKTYKKESEILASASISLPKMHGQWIVGSIVSNIEASDYPGVLISQSSIKTTEEIAKNSVIMSFDVEITPKSGETLELTDIGGSFRASKQNILSVSVKNGENVIVSSKQAADQVKDSKDWRNTRLNLATPLSVTEKTTLSFELIYAKQSKNSNGDKISIGDIKLFFK